MTYIGLNARTNAAKRSALEGYGVVLVDRNCADCGEVVWCDSSQLATASLIRCSDCANRLLVSVPPVEPDRWQKTGDVLRAIRWGPPVAEAPKPARLDEWSALTKVRRAGAPAEALGIVQRQLSGELETLRATAAALSWWLSHRNSKPLLAMLGPTGLGKSAAATRVAYEFAAEWPWNAQAGGGAQREPLVWLQATDLASLQGWFTDGKRQWDEALHAKLLIIDDASHEKTPSAITAMTDLLMQRIDARRQTVLSTNLRGKEFEQRYGQPVVDRMRAKAYAPELGGERSARRAT